MVQCDADGILSLHWWVGNEALKGSAQPVVLDHCQLHRLLPEDCSLQAGKLQLQAVAGGVAILPVKYNSARGVILEAEITLTAADGLRCGVGLFIEGENSNQGTILLSQNDDRLQVGPYDGYSFRPEDGKPLPFAPNQTRRWRLLVRTAHVELYVNDELIQCYALSHAQGGRLGFVIEAGAATVGEVYAWEMSL